MQPIPTVSAFTLLFSWSNSCSIGFKSGDGLGQSKTFNFLSLIKSLTELAGCFESPVDSRLSEHHPSFLEVVGDFTYIYIYIYIYAFSRRFYPKRLTVHSSYSFYILSALAFPGNRTHDLGVANAMLYQLSYRKANTRLLGLIFTAFMIYLSSTAVVF